ncbi:uncharacterized protein LOC104419624 isoform X1 [Eucalyptus grandis]|uniref:Uncharacterized protein n=2 Tax=Eucalyptus grandis TaxID=71139 RepID=A0ACC3JJQ8_EUCGR|nr:uncharacterized protein LOC104419624 isoform X1 [Eucalyptus grandis]KAK3413755.1 hypothetical protein EUGRSUZ_I02312 [Eucalyptus grandis]
MHHLALEVGLVDPAMETTARERESTMKRPICPKPRRLRPGAPDLLKPLRCSQHCQQNGDGRSGIGNLIVDKVGLVIQAADNEDESPGAEGGMGSPPTRTNNPLVHDVRFIRQMELLSPFPPAKLPDNFNFPSASPA